MNGHFIVPVITLRTCNNVTKCASQAVRLKEKKQASEVIAVSCGPQACQVSFTHDIQFG